MRAQFFLAGLAVAAISAPAFATTYLSVEQAQAAFFPGAALTAAPHTLTDAQAAAIRAQSGVAVTSRAVHAWRAANGGWFIVDQVIGKHDAITFALGIDAQGAVCGFDVLEYRESYGYQVRNAAWRAQFLGKRTPASIRFGRDIQNISGATLSSRHLTEGVQRLLATYAVALRT